MSGIIELEDRKRKKRTLINLTEIPFHVEPRQASGCKTKIYFPILMQIQ
jgi:hypothetical protein